MAGILVFRCIMPCIVYEACNNISEFGEQLPKGNIKVEKKAKKPSSQPRSGKLT